MVRQDHYRCAENAWRVLTISWYQQDGDRLEGKKENALRLRDPGPWPEQRDS